MNKSTCVASCIPHTNVTLVRTNPQVFRQLFTVEDTDRSSRVDMDTLPRSKQQGPEDEDDEGDDDIMETSAEARSKPKKFKQPNVRVRRWMSSETTTASLPTTHPLTGGTDQTPWRARTSALSTPCPQANAYSS